MRGSGVPRAAVALRRAASAQLRLAGGRRACRLDGHRHLEGSLSPRAARDGAWGGQYRVGPAPEIVVVSVVQKQ